MLRKILIVEDDQFFREAIRDLLKTKFNVVEAENGLFAIEALTTQNIDIVLSDIQMPKMTGLQLLDWAKTSKPDIPFVIMTGFSAILETRSAFDLGAKGFIAKPFRNQDLLNTINEVLNPSDSVKQYPEADAGKDYCKVSIEEFVARPKIDFDVYIKLTESKIIKIAHKGDEIPKEKVLHYKDKGVKHLYLRREDFDKLVKFNLGLANLIKERTDISQQKKLNFLKYTGEVILERTFVDGINKASLQEAKVFLEMTLDAITDCPENMDVLSLLNQHSDHIYAHSLGVAMYSVMLARQLGFESNAALVKLSMAGIFHDVGKKEIDRQILDKPRHLVTQEERKVMESHVLRGQEILSALPNIPDDVVQIVSEHHEDLESLGYPLRKEKFALHPLSKILQCANIFIESSLAGPRGPGKPAHVVIANMESIYGGRVDKHCLAALKVLFKDAEVLHQAK